MFSLEARKQGWLRGVGVLGVLFFLLPLMAWGQFTVDMGSSGKTLVLSGLIGDLNEVEDISSEAVVAVRDFAMKWVRHHVEVEGRMVVLNRTVSIKEQKLYYTQDGEIKALIRYQKRNEEGLIVPGETELRLGTNYHVTFFLDWQDEEQSKPPVHQTHYFVILRDLDQILAVASHIWFDGHVDRTLDENAEEKSFVAIMDDAQEFTVNADGTHANAHAHDIEFKAAQTTKEQKQNEGKRKQVAVVEEAKDKNIKFVSFNIWNLNQPWEQRKFQLEEQIIAEDPDIIGWQEVRYSFSNFRRRTYDPETQGEAFRDESLQGNTGRLQVEQLAHLPGFKNYQFVYTPAMTYLNLYSSYDFHSDEGLAIFSKYPILNTTVKILTRDLSDRQDEHQRICLRALVEVPGKGKVNFYVTHLTLSDDARDRTVAEIWDFVEEITLDMGPDADVPNVLTGDFNALPSSSSLEFLVGKKAIKGKKAGFRDAWIEMLKKKQESNELTTEQEQLGYSFPTWKPEKRIDFFLLNGNIDVANIYLIGNTTLPTGIPEAELTRMVSSDHLGLATLLTLTKK